MEPAHGRKGRRKTLGQDRREPGPFAAIPHRVLNASFFPQLSAHAVRLLLDLAVQFRGFNNGDLTLAWSIMKPRGWRSRDTLNKARKELLAVELIEVSRHGDRRRPHLYSLTFIAVDECEGKLDVKPTQRPTSEWKKYHCPPPVKLIPSRTPGVSKPNDMHRPPGNLKQSDTPFGPAGVS